MKTRNHIKNWKKSIFWIIPMLLLGIIACREELNQEYFETSELSVKTSEITKSSNTKNIEFREIKTNNDI